MASVTVVGPGRMGLALAGALANADETMPLTVFGRRPEPPAHPLFTQGRARYVFGMEPLPPDTFAVFLAVPDDVVPEMAFTLAGQGAPPAGCAAFHLSAALPTDVLGPLHGAGYEVGAFRPFVIVRHPVSGAERISGSTIAVVSSPEGVGVARRLGGLLDARVVPVPAARRPLLDAASVLAGASTAAMLLHAARLLERAGVPGEEAIPALLPLLRDALDAAEAGDLEATWPGLTSDTERLSLHLRALDPDDRVFYEAIGREMIRLGGGELDPEDRRALMEQLGTDG